MDSTFYTNLPASTPTNSSALLMEASVIQTEWEVSLCQNVWKSRLPGQPARGPTAFPHI